MTTSRTAIKSVQHDYQSSTVFLNPSWVCKKGALIHVAVK